jgi:hypothetical protein
MTQSWRGGDLVSKLEFSHIKNRCFPCQQLKLATCDSSIHRTSVLYPIQLNSFPFPFFLFLFSPGPYGCFKIKLFPQSVVRIEFVQLRGQKNIETYYVKEVNGTFFFGRCLQAHWLDHPTFPVHMRTRLSPVGNVAYLQPCPPRLDSCF